MTEEQRIKNISIPSGRIDVVLDTDAYNEIDDQFAIAYLLRSSEKLNTVAIYAAPFHNRNSEGPADGMEKSYYEILKLLKLMGTECPVFKGSDGFLSDEQTPIISPAALDLVKRAENYSPENPLYVVAIGAITNIASALLIKPEIAENIVVIWLGGHSLEYHDTAEFNMVHDIAAASGVPYVQLPCFGVVSSFAISKPELEYWLAGKNPLADYLARNTVAAAERYASGKPWTRVIWDVTAVAWLLNENDKFMLSKIIDSPLPTYERTYGENPNPQKMRYVYYIKRDALMDDLIGKILNK